MSRICSDVGESGKLWFFELDHEKMRLLKTHVTAWLWSKENAKKTFEWNADPTPKVCRVLAVWRRRGGKALRQTDHIMECKHFPKGRGTQALLQGTSHTTKFPRAVGMAGVG